MKSYELEWVIRDARDNNLISVDRPEDVLEWSDERVNEELALLKEERDSDLKKSLELTLRKLYYSTEK
jgi:hypothetical protein